MCVHHLEAASGEAADKDDLLGGLADVDKASASWSAWREIRDVHIPLLVHLLSDKACRWPSLVCYANTQSVVA